MAVHAMIDLETLGTKPDCTIISIGAIKFDPFTNIEPHNGIYYKADIDEQSELGRTVDDSTLEWWGKQDSKIRDEALTEGDRTSVDVITDELNKFLVGVDGIWAQGPAFDIVILENLYRQLNKPTPWNFWQIRDSRTLFAMMPQDPRKSIQQDLHNALADCYFQAKCVQQSYKHFGITQ